MQTFTFFDWIVGITACVGLSYVYNDDRTAEVRPGKGLVCAGLVLQGGLYGLYLVVLGLWHARARREGRGGVEGVRVRLGKVRWYLAALYACGVLILIRCVYRTIEYFQDHVRGYLATREVYFCVLDALPILGMMVVLNVFHSGRYFPEDCQVYLARDEVREVRGPGWADERRWWWAVIDPLRMWEWWTGRGRQEPNFWEREEVMEEEEKTNGSKEEGPAG